MWLFGCGLTGAAVRPEAEGSRSALIAAPTHHVGFTVALTSDPVALTAEGPLRVALTGWTKERLQ